jgi:cytochrome c-type biogenesis protein CcmH/NrfG
MTWLQIVSLLACPVMMLFCMRGMLSKNSCKNMKHGNQGASSEQFQQLQQKVAELSEQNHHLMKELRSMKNTEVSMTQAAEK